MTLAAIIVFALAAGWAWVWLMGPWRRIASEDVPAPAMTRARAEALALLAEYVYGPEPHAIAPVVVKREEIAAADAGGVEGVEQCEVSLGAAGRFHLVLVLPRQAREPLPVIVVQNFCGNRAAFPERPRAIADPLNYCQWDCSQSWLDPVAHFLFGKYVTGPPFELVTSRGYALALMYGGDVVPDRPQDARAALARFAPAETGAISAWAWGFSRAYDVLAADARFDATRVAVWGQSRQGKAALLAGARDERFAAVIGLQAGRGGDALTAHRRGESVAKITRTYPHWFAPAFASFAESDPPVDQHELLAAIAPRPVLTGHAWRDAWADPAGAEASAAAAGAHFFMREGRHGIVREDWEQTLRFLDAQFRRAHVPGSPRE